MSIVDWLSQTLLNYCDIDYQAPAAQLALSTLDWMEQSALGQCVAQTPAGYYVLLGFHALGLAMIVGVMMVVDLRILGTLRGISAQALPKFVTIGWWGFWINAVSGVLIFFSEANMMFVNTTFRWKLFLILIGMITTTIFNQTILRPAAAGDAGKLAGRSAKGQALFSLLIWLAVIITGRMIAYLSDK